MINLNVSFSECIFSSCTASLREDTMPLLHRGSGAISAMNNMQKLSIRRAIIPDDVILPVSLGIVWDVQLCVERENIMALPCSLAKAFQFFPMFHKDCWQERMEYGATWNYGVWDDNWVRFLNSKQMMMKNFFCWLMMKANWKVQRLNNNVSGSHTL